MDIRATRKTAGTFALLAVAAALALLGSPAHGGLFIDASLKSGDYGGGLTQDTMNPNQGGSPHVLGIQDWVEGVTFTPTEGDGRSNAVIYWQPGVHREQFRRTGAIQFAVFVDSQVHGAMAHGGDIWCDNYGWNQFNHGQATFSCRTGPISGDPSHFSLSWQALHGGNWYYVTGATAAVTLDYDHWYTLGYAWGGPDHDYEFSVDGVLVGTFDLPGGVSFPWGLSSPPSGTNWGLGSLHERGIRSPYAYGSCSGVTYADLKAWDEYVRLWEAEQVIPEPATLSVLGLALLALARRRRA